MKSQSLKIPTIWAGKKKKGRGRRKLPTSGGYFVHVTSRAVQQRFLFGAPEKEAFVRRMRDWAEFSGLTVLTHCLMDNHFHIFLWVSDPEPVPYEELVRRMGVVWDAKRLAKWKECYEFATPVDRKAMLEEQRERMHNLPEFMRVLKQTFSTWYNHAHQVKGTLWESRYQSMVVQNACEALITVGTYIDLNPIRAGICTKPEEYTWSAFGAACAGDAAAREGLVKLMEESDLTLPMGQSLPKRHTGWEACRRFYLSWLYYLGRSLDGVPNVSPKRKARRGFKSFEVLKVFEAVLC